MLNKSLVLPKILLGYELVVSLGFGGLVTYIPTPNVTHTPFPYYHLKAYQSDFLLPG